MPAKDAIHDFVKNALIKDGWTITSENYTIRYEEIKLFADLTAERPLVAERSGQKIIVEIKSFLGTSPMRDLEEAVGQYIIYRNLLEALESDYDIYLAINQRVYITFFEKKAIQLIVQQNQIRLIVVDIENEVITQWIS
ncbi:fdxN element excision controlling factor XisH-like protein [Rivularia sp. IAM M-261]|nr:fdxN element excision controlling factor XisH-like protein [Calothrix sp. PCC 7716]GJD17874.1 fdxN element excision controlling factor XisH-like protein [Rivularia sp. IAM M-261]